MQKAFACLLSFTLSVCNFLQAQTQLPTPSNIQKPSGVSAPGEAFNPMIGGSAPGNAPQIAEWTRTAGPDESLVISGSNLSRFSGKDEGKDSRFTVYGAGGVQKEASIQRIDGDKAIITLPSGMNRWGMYLIWPGNDAGYGNPMAVNKTDLWWVGPNQAAKGSVASVFGRNLANQNGKTTSHVYLKSSGGSGQWAEIVKVNPYRVDFRVPTSLSNGTYEVWVHNGHGGDYGWSGPSKLVINSEPQWTNQVFNVKDFGAKGDGVTDDIAAIRRALVASSRNPGCKVYFPAGTYLVSDYMDIENFSRWQGDGPDKTIIKCAPYYNSNAVGLVFSNSKKFFEIDGIAFNTNYSYRGKIDKPISLRHSTDVRINNVKFLFHKYNILDVHESERVFVTNSEFIGMVTFLGSGSQLFFDNCTFRQTHNANNSLYMWGGHEVSITNSTCQDLDNSNINSMDGWGTGRFLTGDGNWGSNYNTYLAGNTGKDLTINPMAPDQNMGEIFMWEGTYTDHIGTVSNSSATQTTINGYWLPNNKTRYATIVKGKGFGQSRRITSANGNVISVAEPWNVTPDHTSEVYIGSYIDRIVVYDNYLDGKPRALYNERHIAAAGIQPFSGTSNFIADNNTLHELRQGTSNWAMYGSNGRLEPNYFSMYINNKYINCRDAIMNIAPVKTPNVTAMFGTLYRRNTVQSPIRNAVLNEVETFDQPYFNSTVYEHNTMQNVPVAFEVIHWYLPHLHTNAAVNQLFYKNNLSGNGRGPAIKMQKGIALRENTYSNFTNNHTKHYVANNIIEGPNRVIQVTATAYGNQVETPLTIWNSGTSATLWNLTKQSSWLTTSQTSGTLEHEKDQASVKVIVNPKLLGPGDYKETITVESEGRFTSFTLLLKVNGKETVQKPEPDAQLEQQPEPQPQPQPQPQTFPQYHLKIGISFPTTQTTFRKDEVVSVNADVEAGESVRDVEIYINNKKAATIKSAPYIFETSGLPAGKYEVLGKVNTTSGRAAFSKNLFFTVNDILSDITCANTGGLYWEYKMNIPWGTALTYERPTNYKPDGSRIISSFATPSNFGNHYLARTIGFVCPPESGQYTFFLSSDDNGELWISSDENSQNGRKIASVNGWTSPGQFNKFASQQSGTIYLEKGKRYFIEAVHLENNGDDHLTVAWKMPNGTFQSPISGQHLIPYQPQTQLLSSTAAKAGTLEMTTNPKNVLAAGTMEIAPNPVQSTANIRFAVPESGKTVVELYNGNGALVTQLFNGVTEKQTTYQVSLNGTHLPNGVYYCRLVSGATILQKQVVIAH